MTVGGRYHVQEMLGAGGFAEVWEALDHTLGRRVAIKFVTGVMRYPEAAKRFAREARTLASLHHGSIVTVHDAGTIDHEGHTLPYLVMELLNGVTWETAQVDSVLETGARLADVLAHIHEANIVHRDVKPANIMICADGRTVLMDFGIARDDNSLTRTATTTGKIFGTPAYMAPEQLQGRAATPASDIYALGLVLVEKLTGHRLPAAQLTPQARAAIPEPLLHLLTRMTSPFPDQRPTAAECATLLRASAVPPKPPKPLRPTRGGTLERLAGPSALFTLLALVMFLPGYSTCGNYALAALAAEVACEGDATVIQSFGAQGRAPAFGVFVGLATVLAMAAVLTPRSRAVTRLTGYAGVVVTAGCVLLVSPVSSSSYFYGDTDALRFGMWLFYLAAALTVATYVYRDVRTRRERPR
ncbi:serine/threonine-protein kinase [Streptomyces sparsogenes]|uniref:serine/threonine-protein kinase n=1 Tax=Streptomyces sparsogenes TaxID=67365 RepID=UPI0033D74BF2